MLRHELLVGLELVRGRRLLPVPVLGELLQPALGLDREFAVRVLLQEVLIGLAGIGALGGVPLILDAAAAGEQHHGHSGDDDWQQS